MRNKTWDWLAWVAFIILLVYFFLKIIGVFNSPILADMIAFVSAGYFVGRYAMKIDTIFRDVEYLKKDVRHLNDRVFREK
ncbi:hypothetical protein J4406_00500 [Candidatus Woesearchaeota archaeon]|nr:hypothetical protein [Candidatus Woesearchaeota archaeon]